MEPRRPKHKQQPPLVVTQDEIERALRKPESYNHGDASELLHFPRPPGDAEEIQVVHTHLSMVFLLPQRVYKLKKPVDFGFVDFSTLYKRFQACVAEVQLNQRLAPHIYMGVVPVSMHRETRKITVRGDDFWTPEKNNNLDYWLHAEFGEIIEWAVRMVRLPDACALSAAMAAGLLTAATLRDAAETLVAFHRDARRSPRIDAFGKEDVIRRNIDENFAQTASHVDVEATVSRAVYDRVQQLTYAQLKELAPTIQARVDHGYICDCHGDLRLEHIYALDVSPESTAVEAARLVLSPTKKQTKKKTALVIIDCIEFNEQFRFGDPLSDVAFLMMDVWQMGRPDLARGLQEQYLLLASQDTAANRRLFRFYAAYRAVVRAKVSGFRVADANLDAAHRDRERQRARRLWLVALSLLAPPPERPCLLLVGGLPASGKSNLARMLAGDESNVYWLRADAIRKELMGRELLATAGSSSRDQDGSFVTSALNAKGGSFEEGLYAPQVTQRTYDEILIRCVGHLRHGDRVVVDATFRDPQLRARFIGTARDEGALFALVICDCDREIIKGRMLARKQKTGEISDATWEVYEHMEAQWRLDDVQELAELFVVNTEKEEELTLRRTNVFLRQIELLL